MAQENLTITVKNRIAHRVQNTKGRKEELIPAVVYGPKLASTPVFLTKRFFVLSKATEGNDLYTLDGDMDGSKVMIKKVMRNPIGNKILHVDLYAPDMSKAAKVEVELDFTGEPEGVKEGGLIQILRRSIEIECPVTEIPKSIEVDISGMKIGDTLKMADVKVSEKFKVLSALEYAVISITEAAREEEEVVVAAEEAPAAEGEAAAAPAADAPKS